MARRKTVVLGILGTTLDTGHGKARWARWRPTVSLGMQEDFLIDRIELLRGANGADLARTVVADIGEVSPDTQVVEHELEFADPWDFESVYGSLLDFARSYPFDPEKEDYLVHITTGTHVAQICLFLLAEARYFPARLLQTSPGRMGEKRSVTGTYAIIDLDLSKYDRLASRVRDERVTAQSLLKSGIETKNAAFNALVERIEHVAVATRAPILLTGPTGAGKSKLARRIFELKKAKRQVSGDFAEVNCATLRGDTAMSTLFGHVRGAFTGALSERPGLLKKANGGVLFLDEIGELGVDEQAMLLRAIEEKVFYPMGSDREVSSDFQLITGTNRDLSEAIARGAFREDLLARIDLWTFRLPALHERVEDISPNLDFELDGISRALGTNITMSREARSAFLRFAATWTWPGNFRDFNASVTRMATFAKGGRITDRIVDEEVEYLRSVSRPSTASMAGMAGRKFGTSKNGRIGNGASGGARTKGDEAFAEDLLPLVLGEERSAELDRFDRVQLADVLAVCREARSLADAGRELFAQSRASRASVNDSDRLRKYLARFGVEFADVKRA